MSFNIHLAVLVVKCVLDMGFGLGWNSLGCPACVPESMAIQSVTLEPEGLGQEDEREG